MEPCRTRALVLRKDDATRLEYEDPPRAVYIWLDRSAGARHLDCGTLELAPGEFPPEHAHAVAEEVMWVHCGRGIMRLDGEEFPVEEGTLVFAPPGVRHQFVNTGDEVMVAFYVYSPSGTESQFRLREQAGRGSGLAANLPAPGDSATPSENHDVAGGRSS